MKLSSHDLKQIDQTYLSTLTHSQLLILTTKAFSDLNECHDRLNQNSTNSSTPSSAEKPWVKANPGKHAADNTEEDPEDQLVNLDKEEQTEKKTSKNSDSQKMPSEEEKNRILNLNLKTSRVNKMGRKDLVVHRSCRSPMKLSIKPIVVLAAMLY
jgi:hypothetical protein